MTRERLDTLAGRALDEELSPAEAAALAQILRAQPAWRRDLRRDLVLWEFWSQAATPERSADAFVAAWQTRLAAEAGAEDFSRAVQARLERESSPAARTHAALATLFAALRRPLSLAGATTTLLVLLVGGLWLATSRSARATITLRGEAVCTASILHEGHAHLPAVRVRSGGAALIYYLEPSPALTAEQGRFCSGPAPIVVEGQPQSQASRVILDVSRFELSPPPKPADNERILFPL